MPEPSNPSKPGSLRVLFLFAVIAAAGGGFVLGRRNNVPTPTPTANTVWTMKVSVASDGTLSYDVTRADTNCSYASPTSQHNPPQINVCVGDTIQFYGQTPDKNTHQLFVVFPDNEMSQPFFYSTNGVATSGKVANQPGNYEYYIYIADTEAESSETSDPQIIVGKGKL
jgi:plastocyanin